jgi:2-hydroxyacyl-CoA lyase 1
MMEAFGGKGYFVTESSELKPALQAALSTDGPSLVNIMINNRATRKPQEFRWLTT